MTGAVRRRILAFVVLSAVGIVYVASAYLGLVDAILGRGYTLRVSLPASGGLFEGSEATYRGVKVGKVEKMSVTRDGVMVEVAMEEGTELPLDSEVYVYNLSAVGEQYLDFQPEDAGGPYAEDGDLVEGSTESLPVDEGDLLVSLDAFVDSVDKRALQVLIRELGDTFEDTGGPLQRLIDDGGDFIDAAADSTDDTIRLLETAETVLGTQRGQRDNIRSFSADLADLTEALRESDDDLRGTLDDTPATAREVTALMEDLEPTLPILLSDLTTINQVVVSHIEGVEQLLVTFPRVIAGGFTGTTRDGFGHVNLQLESSTPPCTEGYKPRDEWRRGDELSDSAIFPARCLSGAPFVQRGTPNVPDARRDGADPSPPRSYTSSYDPTTGLVDGAVAGDGSPVRVQQAGDLSLLGDDSWKWLLIAPTLDPVAP